MTGIAKGAGMIRPNMATMLAYIATDAAVDGAVLQASAGRGGGYVSFNRITVDGDTSTNDACVLVATGAAGNTPLTDLDRAAGCATARRGGGGGRAPRPGPGAGRRGRQQVCHRDR